MRHALLLCTLCDRLSRLRDCKSQRCGERSEGGAEGGAYRRKKKSLHPTSVRKTKAYRKGAYAAFLFLKYYFKKGFLLLGILLISNLTSFEGLESDAAIILKLLFFTKNSSVLPLSSTNKSAINSPLSFNLG